MVQWTTAATDENHGWGEAVSGCRRRMKEEGMRYAIVLVCILVIACDTMQRPERTSEGYKQILSTWLGSKSDQLVRQWGPPDSSFTYADGSSVLVYKTTRTETIGGTTYRERVEVDLPGTSEKGTVWIEKTTPIDTFHFYCNTTFEIDPQGRITSWEYEGNDCKAVERKETAPPKIGTELQTTETESHMSRGKAHMNDGAYGLAIKAFDEAIRLDPDNKDAYVWRGFAYARSSDYERALRDFNAAIRLDPSSAVGYRARGTVYRLMEKFEASLADYDRAILIDPEYAAAYINRCQIYGLMLRPRQGLEDCNESLRLQPNLPAALDSRAFVLWQLGKREQAREDLERARELESDLPTWQERFRHFERLYRKYTS